MSAFISSIIKAASGSGTVLPNATEDMCFTVDPQSGESGFSQWVAAMKMVAQLPGGIPPEFRKRLWLTMAEKHIASRGVDWNRVERTCFSEWSHPDDGELGVQIVKDLHRTGCSLFCGEGGQENQALLKKVLLAYARWNKAVGYCQGFNMLAALILQVTDKSESDALKLMIYLIEGVLPDSYFADSLRGLSVDMAVFRELLRTRLPRLSKHLDLLQNMAKEGTTSYEPPLTNVFTMQWFLTLFCNCLPQPSVLRVWDLILLEGNEILLRTALAIWQTLADRIIRVRTADEFYCIMGLLTNELLENNLIDANTLIKAVVTIGPLTELRSLREHYLYNINPWGAMPAPVEFSEKQLKLYPKEKLALDISTLKKQYMKLRQRQRQAHIIFTAAISRQPPPRAPVAMNHLLLGKSAIVPAKRIGPPKGSIPPARVPAPSTLHWKDTSSRQSSSSSSSDTELCDDNDPVSETSDEKSQPHDDLPEDNPTIDSDSTELMIKDNTVEEVESCANINVVNDNQNSAVSDIFDSLVTNPSCSTTKFDVEKVLDVDSEDDSMDFEIFLEDRVKCLKGDKSPTEEEKRVSLSRRNSERALQIIQENSVILQRILQCQSRLSLSPPTTETDDETLSKKSIDSCRHSGDGTFSSSCSEITNQSKDCCSELEASDNFRDVISPLPETPKNSSEENFTYSSSKYSDIMEKSKNLNDKYNNLILNINPADSEVDEITLDLPESKTFTSKEQLLDLTSTAEKSEISDSPLISNIQPWLDNVVSYQISSDTNNENLDEPKVFCSEASVASTQIDEKNIEIPNVRSQFKSKSPLDDLPEDKLLIDITTPPVSPFKKSSDSWLKDEVRISLSTDYLSKSPNISTSGRKSLSATNSFEKHEKPEAKRSLSATNSIERTSSPSSRSLIERITESNEDICTRLRKNMKSPESRCQIEEKRLTMSPSPEKSPDITKNLSPSTKYSHEFKYPPSDELRSSRTSSFGNKDFGQSGNYRTSRSPSRDSSTDNLSNRQTRTERSPLSRDERVPRIERSPMSKDERVSRLERSPLSKDDIRTHRSSSPLIRDIKSPIRNINESTGHYRITSPETYRKSSPIRRDWAHEDSDTKYSKQKNPLSPQSDRKSSEDLLRKLSPLKRDDRSHEDNQKSPNKTFNPFPVPLSSRQNKEVAVKLGLYKK